MNSSSNNNQKNETSINISAGNPTYVKRHHSDSDQNRLLRTLDRDSTNLNSNFKVFDSNNFTLQLAKSWVEFRNQPCFSNLIGRLEIKLSQLKQKSFFKKMKQIPKPWAVLIHTCHLFMSF